MRIRNFGWAMCSACNRTGVCARASKRRRWAWHAHAHARAFLRNKHPTFEMRAAEETVQVCACVCVGCVGVRTYLTACGAALANNLCAEDGLASGVDAERAAVGRRARRGVARAAVSAVQFAAGLREGLAREESETRLGRGTGCAGARIAALPVALLAGLGGLRGEVHVRAAEGERGRKRRGESSEETRVCLFDSRRICAIILQT